MPYSSRTENTGSLGEPRRTFGHMSFNADERTHNVTGGHQDAKPITEPTVLIADDDDDTRVMFRTLLGTKGYRVVEASDGEEVIEVTTAADERTKRYPTIAKRSPRHRHPRRGNYRIRQTLRYGSGSRLRRLSD